ncbi:hypothetical protein BREVNS_0392 [Brevinematales bacterium NS]|nr:hypothetical protein BREVNS_0392 [Brevinematales bacterium NS]
MSGRGRYRRLFAIPLFQLEGKVFAKKGERVFAFSFRVGLEGFGYSLISARGGVVC